MNKFRQPSNREIFGAYDKFRALLSSKSRENDWQRFFAKNPFVLSRALPLKLEPREIIPLGRPGKSEPDFVFYPKSSHEFPTYGVIEIKRPDTPILTSPRKDIILLTREADTAIKQAQHYAQTIRLPDEILFLGSNQYIFVIMGLSKELGNKLAGDITRAYTLLPPQCQLLPFDILLRRFEKTLPRKLIALVPAFPSNKEIIYEFVNRLSDEHRMLIVLKKHLYDGSWKLMLKDLRFRFKNPPYVFRLAHRIAEDIKRVGELQKFEIKHNIDLNDYIDLD